MRDCKHGQLARSCDRCADEVEITELREDGKRYRWLLTHLAGTKRADFFEPLRQRFYEEDEKYPDADAIQAAIDTEIDRQQRN